MLSCIGGQVRLDYRIWKCLTWSMNIVMAMVAEALLS